MDTPVLTSVLTSDSRVKANRGAAIFCFLPIPCLFLWADRCSLGRQPNRGYSLGEVPMRHRGAMDAVSHHAFSGVGRVAGGFGREDCVSEGIGGKPG